MVAPILIVDHNPAVRELVAYGLCRAGLPIESAATGGEALARICGSRPGALVLDLSLPDIHGVGVIEIVRQLWSDDPVPLIVLSSGRSNGFQTELLGLGADAVLEKPFVLEELITEVRRLCRSGNGLGQKTARRPRHTIRRRTGGRRLTPAT